MSLRPSSDSWPLGIPALTTHCFLMMIIIGIRWSIITIPIITRIPALDPAGHLEHRPLAVPPGAPMTALEDPAQPAISRGELIALIAMLSSTIAFSIDAMLPVLPQIAEAVSPLGFPSPTGHATVGSDLGDAAFTAAVAQTAPAADLLGHADDHTYFTSTLHRGLTVRRTFDLSAALPSLADDQSKLADPLQIPQATTDAAASGSYRMP